MGLSIVQRIIAGFVLMLLLLILLGVISTLKSAVLTMDYQRCQTEPRP